MKIPTTSAFRNQISYTQKKKGESKSGKNTGQEKKKAGYEKNGTRNALDGYVATGSG